MTRQHACIRDQKHGFSRACYLLNPVHLPSTEKKNLLQEQEQPRPSPPPQTRNAGERGAPTMPREDVHSLQAEATHALGSGVHHELEAGWGQGQGQGQVWGGDQEHACPTCRAVFSCVEQLEYHTVRGGCVPTGHGAAKSDDQAGHGAAKANDNGGGTDGTPAVTGAHKVTATATPTATQAQVQAQAHTQAQAPAQAQAQAQVHVQLQVHAQVRVQRQPQPQPQPLPQPAILTCPPKEGAPGNAGKRKADEAGLGNGPPHRVDTGSQHPVSTPSAPRRHHADAGSQHHVAKLLAAKPAVTAVAAKPASTSPTDDMDDQPPPKSRAKQLGQGKRGGKTIAMPVILARDGGDETKTFWGLAAAMKALKTSNHLLRR